MIKDDFSKQINLFTSESVCAGHPDKICDAISDAILDSALLQDKYTRSGIETIVGSNKVELFGEIKTKAKIDYELIVRETITKLGYIEPKWGFSNQSQFINNLHQQSPEIALGVDDGGAGDQGMMFGFAVKETEDLMPLPIAMAHSITKKIDYIRENDHIEWLRPDGKAQVTIRYKNNLPYSLEKLVVAVAHDEKINNKQVKQQIIELVLKPVLEDYGFDLPDLKDIIVNGTGVWHIPGPESDAGLTGRKIVVDTYGGYARVGGGAFSGKDPTKVDRSGAYAARFIAKNIVANGFADKCEVGLAYVIGQPLPLMQTIETFGTNTVSQAELYKFKNNLIDTSVKGIIERLDLRKPIYSQTSAYGHFGKKQLSWEKLVNI